MKNLALSGEKVPHLLLYNLPEKEKIDCAEEIAQNIVIGSTNNDKNIDAALLSRFHKI